MDTVLRTKIKKEAVRLHLVSEAVVGTDIETETENENGTETIEISQVPETESGIETDLVTTVDMMTAGTMIVDMMIDDMLIMIMTTNIVAVVDTEVMTRLAIEATPEQAKVKHDHRIC